MTTGMDYLAVYERIKEGQLELTLTEKTQLLPGFEGGPMVQSALRTGWNALRFWYGYYVAKPGLEKRLTNLLEQQQQLSNRLRQIDSEAKIASKLPHLKNSAAVLGLERKSKSTTADLQGVLNEVADTRSRLKEIGCVAAPDPAWEKRVAKFAPKLRALGPSATSDDLKRILGEMLYTTV